MEILGSAEVEAERLQAFLIEQWHAEVVVAHDEPMRLSQLPGFVAVDAAGIVGHVAYRVAADACELVAIAVDPPWRGTGSALLQRVVEAARSAGCGLVWLTTTNDNLDALRFYQRRGFRLSRVRPGAVDEARRRLKPEIPSVGSYGIPMRDEIDLALDL